MENFLTGCRQWLALATLSLLLPAQVWAGDFQFTVKAATQGKMPEATGCLQKSTKKSVDLKACLQDKDLKNSIKYYWKIDDSRTQARGCQLVTEAVTPAALIKEVSMSICAENLKVASASWTKNSNGEVNGCAPIAAFRNLKVQFSDINWCVKYLAADVSYVMTYDLDRNAPVDCEAQVNGKPIASREYEKEACDLKSARLEKVIFVRNGNTDQASENLVSAWDNKENSRCLLISEKSLRVIGTSQPDNCSAAVLISKDGKNSLKQITPKRTASFRQLLLKDDTNVMMKNELGADCVSAINNISSHGGSLRSSILAKASKPLRSIKFFSGSQDDLFYHWTHSPGLLDLFKLNSLSPEQASARAQKENLYEYMFKYLRTRQADRYAFWRRVMYVAEDPKSSAFLGDKLVIFKMNMNARTLSYDHPTWQLAVNEVTKKYPELEKYCKTNLDWSLPDTFGTVFFQNIFMIVAEDSGVDVIDYNQGARWFQVLTPSTFTGVYLGGTTR